LLKTATDLGKPGVDEVYGNGLVNLDKATNPIGTLALAKIGSSAPTQSKTAITSTGLVSGSIGAQSLKNSVVLQNTQVVDSMGRNYTVDLSRSVSATVPNQYQGISAYSNLSVGDVRTVNFNAGAFTSTMFGSDNIGGFRLDRQFLNGYTVGMEIGSASERNGALGMAGSGGLSVGDSQTVWKTLHLSKAFSGDVSVFGSAAFGDTAAKTVGDSLITQIGPIQSQSFTLGVKRQNLFKENDQITAQVTELPHITSGSMTLTGVTGYSYSNITEDGAVATPTVTTETLSLASSYRQYATGLSYSQPTGKHSRLMTGAQLISDNQGGEIKSSVFAKFSMVF
jgi:hypothetical protein